VRDGHEAAVVLEDDASLGLLPLWPVTVRELLAQLPANWTTLQLSHTTPLWASPDLQRVSRGYQITPRDNEKKLSWNTLAYALSRRGALALLELTDGGTTVHSSKLRTSEGVADAVMYTFPGASAYLAWPRFVLSLMSGSSVESTVCDPRSRYGRLQQMGHVRTAIDSLRQVLDAWIKPAPRLADAAAPPRALAPPAREAPRKARLSAWPVGHGEERFTSAVLVCEQAAQAEQGSIRPRLVEYEAQLRERGIALFVLVQSDTKLERALANVSDAPALAGAMYASSSQQLQQQFPNVVFARKAKRANELPWRDVRALRPLHLASFWAWTRAKGWPLQHVWVIDAAACFSGDVGAFVDRLSDVRADLLSMGSATEVRFDGASERVRSRAFDRFFGSSNRNYLLDYDVAFRASAAFLDELLLLSASGITAGAELMLHTMVLAHPTRRFQVEVIPRELIGQHFGLYGLVPTEAWPHIRERDARVEAAAREATACSGARNDADARVSGEAGSPSRPAADDAEARGCVPARADFVGRIYYRCEF
jgi:hypothetical protein